MARPLWSGSLSFGLVNVPVRMFSAVRDLDLHFTQLHEKDGAPIETRRFCSKEDREVGYEEIARAYDFDDERGTVIVTDEDLATVAPRKTRTIDVEAFVDVAEIDPIYFDHPYFLAPAGDSEGTRRAYQLLVEAMSESDRAALGRFVMRTKEYLVAVRVRGGRLTLTTMLFHDEARPAKDIPAGGKKPTKKQLDGAIELIEALAADWSPDDYEDRYRKRLEKVVESKRKGRTIEIPEEEEQPAPVADLLAALEQSLQEARGRRGGGGGNGAKRDGDELEELSRDQLYERAQEEGVEGRSSMSKKDLIKALER
jgi:DNA end-binding protein Ku